MNRKILKIALPSIVSNITVPLLGLVDTTIAGHMGNAVYIGAIAIGSMIFNVIYWLFGFLRMGTSGMTSQALGRRNLDAVATILARSLTVAISLAAAIIVLQYPIGHIALTLIGANAETSHEAWLYFLICVWGAPAMLCLYSLTGWYVGMQNTRLPMFISIFQNIVNIVASFSFVYLMGMKVTGVALGTLIAQWAGLLVSVVLWTSTYGRRLLPHICWRKILNNNDMRLFFTVNRDIFLRTLCLVAVNFFFLSSGASQGTVILAVNTLLMQLFTLYSYVMDGFAFAGEALCGRLHGAGNADGFGKMVRRLFAWGTMMAAVYTIIYMIGGSEFLSLITDDQDVVNAATTYLPWAVCIPVCGMAAFIWDGVFIGITATRGMLVSSVVATLAFFTAYMVLRQPLANHGLWIAFLVYLSARGIVQTVLARHIRIGV